MAAVRATLGRACGILNHIFLPKHLDYGSYPDDGDPGNHY